MQSIDWILECMGLRAISTSRHELSREKSAKRKKCQSAFDAIAIRSDRLVTVQLHHCLPFCTSTNLLVYIWDVNR
jgi:hypothetical protein